VRASHILYGLIYTISLRSCKRALDKAGLVHKLPFRTSDFAADLSMQDLSFGAPVRTAEPSHAF
jgi:hypothetical protein